MVIRNYRWLNSARRVLISTCSAPLVQTGERKQTHTVWPWPTTLTYNPRLAKAKDDPHAENQGQRSNRRHTHMDATKSIISPAMRSIMTNNAYLMQLGIWALYQRFMSNIARKQRLFATFTLPWHTASHTNMLKPKSAAAPTINNKNITHIYYS